MIDKYLYTYCFSIVSHRNAHHVNNLLNEINDFKNIKYEVIITINVLEELNLDLYQFPYKLIKNDKPLGFGANHNNAFKLSNASYFVVCNPDIIFNNVDLNLLSNTLKIGVGVCGPLVLSPSQQIEDSARKFPTIVNLLKRKLFTTTLDYKIESKSIEVDWIAGMFMMFNSDVFKTISGFNECYHMYCEDADICRRLKYLGYSVLLVPSTTVIHDARRDSRRKVRYLWWHLKSMFIFLFLSLKS